MAILPKPGLVQRKQQRGIRRSEQRPFWSLQNARHGIYKALWDKLASRDIPAHLVKAIDVWNIVTSSDKNYVGMGDATFVKVRQC